MQETLETQVQSLRREDPLQEEMATHCSITAWRIPWTEELGGVTKSRTWLSWLILCELFIVNLSLPECSSLNAPEYLISDWMNGGLAWGSNPFLYLWPYGSQFKTVYVCVCVSAKSLQSCLTLCHPMNCSPRGSSVRGVLQARIPEWVAISFSSGSSQPRDRAHVFYVSCIGRQVLYH